MLQGLRFVSVVGIEKGAPAAIDDRMMPFSPICGLLYSCVISTITGQIVKRLSGIIK